MKTLFYVSALALLVGLSSCATSQDTKPIVDEGGKKTVSDSPHSLVSETKPLKKEKLQIVFCFGQSNMVGLADVRTAWYMTQPQYIPPKDVVCKKSRYFNWDFYWSGVRYYEGPKKEEIDALLNERTASRWKWRQRLWGKRTGIEWDEAAWGKHPGGGRRNVYPFLDKKAEGEGIYKRIADILDSKDNQFKMDDAYSQILNRDTEIAEELKRVRNIYLDGTTAEDFDAFEAALATAIEEKTLITGAGKGQEFPTPSKHRMTFAELAQKHLGLPIAKRTYIKAHGAVTGPTSEPGNGNRRNAAGKLTVGYGGGGITRIGPEYGVGITLERLVDAPILIVKCSWGNTALAGGWRPPSLCGAETPVEKARREANNAAEAAKAKKEGREFTPRGAPKGPGKLSYCWGMTMPQIDEVLADPGKYHPEYDPKVGYDVAGLVWFQGYSDQGNPAYGELLATMIKDLRKKVNNPTMPAVCGTLGMAAYPQSSLAGDVNGGMVQASQMPELAGTVDVVNTAPFYPVELDLLDQVRKNTDKDSPEYKKTIAVKQRAISEKKFHYHGSAKCFLLMGDAMARSLANLMAGGTPFINQELKK